MPPGSSRSLGGLENLWADGLLHPRPRPTLGQAPEPEESAATVRGTDQKDDCSGAKGKRRFYARRACRRRCHHRGRRHWRRGRRGVRTGLANRAERSVAARVALRRRPDERRAAGAVCHAEVVQGDGSRPRARKHDRGGARRRVRRVEEKDGLRVDVAEVAIGVRHGRVGVPRRLRGGGGG